MAYILERFLLAKLIVFGATPLKIHCSNLLLNTDYQATRPKVFLKSFLRVWESSLDMNISWRSYHYGRSSPMSFRVKFKKMGLNTLRKLLGLIVAIWLTLSVRFCWATTSITPALFHPCIGCCHSIVTAIHPLAKVKFSLSQNIELSKSFSLRSVRQSWIFLKNHS